MSLQEFNLAPRIDPYFVEFSWEQNSTDDFHAYEGGFTFILTPEGLTVVSDEGYEYFTKKVKYTKKHKTNLDKDKLRAALIDIGKQINEELKDSEKCLTNTALRFGMLSSLAGRFITTD